MLKVEKGFVRVSFSDIKFIMPFGINYRKLMIIMLGKWLRLSVLVLKNSIFTQAVRPWFKFWLRFFFFFPRSVTDCHLVSKAHASPLHAYSTWNLQKLSSWKVSTDSMISRAMKSDTNEHTCTIHGRPTLKDVKRFRNGSVCKPYERSIYERTFWVKLSRIMLYQRSYQPGLSTLQLDKKHLQKRHRIFRHDREPSRIPARTQERLSNKSERLENLFTNVSLWVHLSKMFWETS